MSELEQLPVLHVKLCGYVDVPPFLLRLFMSGYRGCRRCNLHLIQRSPRLGP